jgi:hypothetical protein
MKASLEKPCQLAVEISTNSGSEKVTPEYKNIYVLWLMDYI